MNTALVMGGIALMLSQVFTTTPWQAAFFVGLVLTVAGMLRTLAEGDQRAIEYADTQLDLLKDAYAEGRIDVVELEQSLEGLLGLGSPQVEAHLEAVRVLDRDRAERAWEQAVQRRGEPYRVRVHGSRRYRYYDSGRIVSE